MPKVFVYGTLLGDDSGKNRYNRKISVTSSKHAIISATLYIYTFPYVVLDGTGTVHGKVFELDDATVAAYDDIEGVGKGGYDRDKVMATYDDGTQEGVWVYCFPSARGGRPVHNGQYDAWFDKGLYPIPKAMGSDPRTSKKGKT